MLFFEKKNQKTFAPGPPGVAKAWSDVSKVFCGAFF
jgi:hypothetical protein